MFRTPALTLILCSAPDLRAAEPIDFNRDVRPILSDHCFACHGPDDAQRKAKLRLDTREGLDDVNMIIDRITADDAAMRMPPAKHNKPLTPMQIDTLKRWVSEGTQWSDHWSFVPPQRPEVPDASEPGWARQPLDRFIQARHDAEGLAHAEPADKVTLIRRTTLDLTGLPPSLAEVEAFLADDNPDAAEKLADRLLASPRHGEHMARFWLDAVRYGDTHGLHLDNYREMWPYRDWVIGAFNQGKPYDRFLTEQLAGDLLPEPTLDQQIATGFLRAHVTTSEGGSISEEVYVRNVVDRVDTNGTVLLGLSVACARCHDHKFDPVTQKEYYQLFAFFNNLDGDPLDGNKKDPAPVIKVPTEEQERHKLGLQQQIAAVEKEIAAQAQDDPKIELPDGPLGARFVRVELIGKDTYLSLAEVQAFAADDNVALKGKATQQSVAYGGPPERAIDGNTDGNYSGANSTTHTDKATDPWWELDLGEAKTLDKLVIWNRTDAVPERLQPFRVVLLDAERKPLFVKHIDQAPRPNVEFAVPSGDKFTEQDRAELVKYIKTGGVETPEQKRLKALEKQLSDFENSIATTLVFKERKEPKPAFLLNRGEYEQKKDQVERKLPAFLPPMPSDAPADRLGFAKWLLEPGHPLTARVAVNRFWQQIFGTGIVKTSEDFGAQGSPPSHPKLLDWLAVEYGTPASRYAKQRGRRADTGWGWDTKGLMRSFVLSATYRQSAKVLPEVWEKDPNNRLYARGPRFRLDAETLRDQALFVSGLMVEQLGGPSVKPPQPDGLWFAVGYSGSNTVRFVADKGREKVHRRSVYTFWKRTAPPPQMSAFDAPTREACCVRRERTNTPLQALLLMNDPQYVEAAKGLASRVVAEAESPEERVERMFRLATGRRPDAVEAAELLDTFAALLAGYRDEPKAAKELVGETPGDPAELAAWTVVASVVLNLDEVINK